MTPRELAAQAKATALATKRNVIGVVDDRAVIKIIWSTPDQILLPAGN